MTDAIIELEGIVEQLLPKNRGETINKQLLPAAVAWSEAVWGTASASVPVSLAADDTAAAKDFVKYPVFICGVHRSGTTLMRDLLDHHPMLSVLPSEGTFITNIEPKLRLLAGEEQRKKLIATEWIRRLANPINQPPYWLLGRTTKNATPYVEFASHFNAWWKFLQDDLQVIKSFQPHIATILAYTSCTRRKQIRYWVDKTPTNEQHLTRLWQEFPSAKIIHVVRDPRDTMRSRKKMDPRPNQKRILRDMKRSFQIATRLKDKPDSRYILVKYEELCHEPERTMRFVAGFLDIQFESSLLTPTVAGMPAIANSSFHPSLPAGQVHIRRGAQQADKGSYPEHDILAAVLGKYATQIGYQMPAIGKLRSLLLKVQNEFR